MTMTLDEVRKTRFHMSRRNGYEVTDVDNFVDKVEATLLTMTDEIDHLRRQLDAAQSVQPGPDNSEELARLRGEVDRLGRASDDASALAAENARLQEELTRAVAAQVPDQGPELQRLRDEVDRLGRELQEGSQHNERLARELDEARAGHGVNEGLKQENDRLRGLADAHSQATAEVERLQQENASLKEQLAEASNRSAAQVPAAALAGGAAVLPLRVTTSAEASPAVVRLVQLATEQAESLVTEARRDADALMAEATAAAERTTGEADARAKSVTEQAAAEAARVTKEAEEAAARLNQESTTEAQRRLDEAGQKAHEMTTDARTRADRVESEARVNAERLVQDAEARATNVDREAAERRQELFAALESERDDLVGKVRHLSQFEGSFRSSLGDFLKRQVSALDGATFAPQARPALLTDDSAADGSTTPRLDALLHDQG
jgi:DivIVA domain-containing protein